MRHRTIALATSAILSLSFASVACAADIPLKAPSLAPTAGYNWTGFYIGGHAGYGWGQASPAISGNLLIGPLITVGAIPSSLVTDPKGLLGGLQLGYNYQRDKVVAGIEVDFSLADVHGDASTARPGPILPFATYTTSVGQRLKWFSTVRARLGFTPIETLLIYATGGLAFGKVDNSGNIHRSAILLNYDIPGSESATRTGWTAGGGIEYAVARNWSVKAEYLYYDLGNSTLNATQTPRPLFLVNTASYDFVNRGNIVRAGLNYKFD